MKRWLIMIGLALAVIVAAVVSAGYLATMQVVGRFAPALTSLPTDYGLHAEVVNFHSLDGVSLKGWWLPAQGIARATVILAHGNGGNRSSMLSRAAFLVAHGYNAFPIDLRAHGESSGNYMSPGYLEALDILGAVEAAKRRGQAGPFVAFGHSYGGRASLWAGAQSTDISAVIADATFISLYASLKREADRVGSDPSASFGMRVGMRTANALAQSEWARAFMETAYNFRTGVRLPSQFDDVMPAVSRIGKRPILFIVGDRDTVAPPEDSHGMYDAAQSAAKAILVVAGADHNSTFTTNSRLYETTVLDFLNSGLPHRAP